jgi:predicted PurR-regulated permease PerM
VAAVIVGILLYLARGSLSPFVLGLVLVYVMDPAVQRVSRLRLAGRRLPRGLVVLLIYVIVVVVLVWAVTALVGPLVQQVAAFAADLPAVLAALDEWYRRLALPDPIRNAIDDVLAGLGRATGGLDPGQVLPIARSLAGVVASLFGYLIIPVWAFYLLKDRPALAASANHAIPPTWRRDVWACVGIVNRVFGRWLRAQLFLGVVVGIATFVGLQILGAVVDPRFGDFAILLAVVAGILELLPIIGPILSMIPTLLIALTVRDPVQGLIAVLILYLIVQQLENNVLVPIVQGDAIDLHPSVVILALIVGGAIAGFLGAVFALPLTAAGRDVYRYFFRRLSEDDPAVPPADDPELLPFRDRLPDREGRLPTERTDVPADDPAADRPAPADGTHPAPPRQAVEQGG